MLPLCPPGDCAEDGDSGPPIRQRILDAIADKPGVHMRGLQRVAGVSLSTITHHLRVLESEGNIVGISDGHYRRFFLSTLTLPEEARRLSEADRRVLSECKRPTSLA